MTRMRLRPTVGLVVLLPSVSVLRARLSKRGGSDAVGGFWNDEDNEETADFQGANAPKDLVQSRSPEGPPGGPPGDEPQVAESSDTTPNAEAQQGLQATDSSGTPDARETPDPDVEAQNEVGTEINPDETDGDGDDSEGVGNGDDGAGEDEELGETDTSSYQEPPSGCVGTWGPWTECGPKPEEAGVGSEYEKTAGWQTRTRVYAASTEDKSDCPFKDKEEQEDLCWGCVGEWFPWSECNKKGRRYRAFDETAMRWDHDVQVVSRLFAVGNAEAIFRTPPPFFWLIGRNQSPR